MRQANRDQIITVSSRRRADMSATGSHWFARLRANLPSASIRALRVIARTLLEASGSAAEMLLIAPYVSPEGEGDLWDADHEPCMVASCLSGRINSQRRRRQQMSAAVAQLRSPASRNHRRVALGGNAEMVGGLYKAWNRRDWDAVAAAGDPAIALEEAREVPGARRVQGHHAVLHYLQSFPKVWDNAAWEPKDLLEGDSQVVALVDFVGVAKQSRVPVRWPITHVFTLNEQGKITRLTSHLDHTDALEVAGLHE